MKYFVTIGGREMVVELEGEGVRVDGRALSADLTAMDGTDLHSLLLGNRSLQVLASRDGSDDWVLHVAGRRLTAQVVDERTRAIRKMTAATRGPQGPRALRAPMPGLVVKVEVSEGEVVEAGQGLVIVEAMKMENELKSEGPGRIGKVLVSPGQAVDKDQVLVEFQAPEPRGEEGPEI